MPAALLIALHLAVARTGMAVRCVGYLTQMLDVVGSPIGDSTLLLFTESYPYDVALEATFVEPELPHLREKFDHVIVIPSQRVGVRADLPAGIEVDEGLARLLGSNSAPLALVARAGVSELLWRDIAGRPSVLASVRAMKRLARQAAKAELTRRWVQGLLRERALAPSQALAYTFWCDHAAAGLGLVKRECPDLIVVSRAHGADLYVERHEPPFIPCRGFTLAQLDRLFPDSDRGTEYVVERYPWFANRCEVARMGVVDPGFIAAASPEDRCSLVSCSLVIPIKRVDLILQGIDRAARSRPSVAFSWHHFGEGELKAQIEREARTTLPANAMAHFPGYPGLSSLMHFYKTEPVDAFLNASVSEGTPVAVMEAISCGIPVIATDVGGNPEIVSAANGALVSANPSPNEIADALLALIENRAAAAAMREGSRRVWETKYNAFANYAAFAQRLVDLRFAGRQRN